MIAQKFVNWESATINALKSYEAMQHCIDHYAEDIQAANDRLYNLKSATTDKDPVQGGGSKPEENWVGAIDRKLLLEHKMQDAHRFMAWFSPAWEKLTEAERVLLFERWVVHREDRGRWVESVRIRLFIEQSQCYERCQEALKRLTQLLFGA